MTFFNATHACAALLCCWSGLALAAEATAAIPPPPTTTAAPLDAAFVSVDLLNRNARFISSDGLLAGRWNYVRQPVGVPRGLANGELLSVCQTKPWTKPEARTTTFAGAELTGGAVEIQTRSGRTRWFYQLMNNDSMVHDDALMLPNGNVLMLVWERKTSEECAAAGRDPALLDDKGLWADAIWEVKPGGIGGEIVWRWSAWDHAVQDRYADQPSYGEEKTQWRRVSLNSPRKRSARPWAGLSRLDYDPSHDLIVVWSRNFNEFWGIDHSTKDKEPAASTGGSQGRGGDLLFRFGNPVRFGRPASDQDYPPSTIDMVIGGTGAEAKLSFLYLSGHKSDLIPGQWIESFSIPQLLEGARSETLPLVKVSSQGTLALNERFSAPAPRVTGICPLTAGQGWLCTLGKEGRLAFIPASGPASLLPVVAALPPSMSNPTPTGKTPAPGEISREPRSVTYLLPARTIGAVAP